MRRTIRGGGKERVHPAEKREMLADVFGIRVISWRKSRGVSPNQGAQLVLSKSDKTDITPRWRYDFLPALAGFFGCTEHAQQLGDGPCPI